MVACARRADAVEETAAEIESQGRRTLRVSADVADRASLEGARDVVLEKLGRLDILVNSAGRHKRTPTLDLSEEEWQATIETNLTGTLRSCQVFVRPMLEAGWGRIVNIASLTAHIAFFEVAAYTASKAGVVGLTKALALEWGPKGVNVNGISPGVFPTRLNRAVLEGTERGRELQLRTPLRRFGEPDEVAGAAIFLASEAASFVNGEIIAVDGGFLASGVNQ